MNISFEKINDSSVEILGNTTSKWLQFDHFHSSLYSSLSSKILYSLLLIFTHIVGPILTSGIIYFERKGGDPQKRNVINRLFSMALINQILFSILVGSCRFWRMMFGLISVNVMFWIDCVGYIACINFIFFMNEMTIFRYLHIVVWKRVRGLDDGFWAFFLSAATIGWSCWQCVFEHIPPQAKMHVFKLSMDIQPSSLEEKR